MANPQPLQALLAQTGWIHALARRLVADPHLAADLAQDTCIQALERAPDTSRPLRGWLATVMRNHLAKLRRGEASRVARERTGRAAELEVPAQDVVEKAETHRNVVLAVLALAEPYRSTLLMRFFEQLSYDEIAHRTGVTRAAVNSRVTRGLAELRQRLETTYGGNRRALGLALIPLAKLPTGVALSTTTLLGLKTMHIAIGTAAATLLAATVTVGLRSGGHEPAQPSRNSSVATTPTRERVELQAPFVFEPATEPLAEPLESREEGRVPLTREQKHQDSDRNEWRTELFQSVVLAPTVELLTVNTGSGDVEVLASNSGKLEVQARVSAKLDKVKQSELTQVFEDHVEILEEDGVLRVDAKHKNARGWSVSFVVSVPGRLPLGANSGSGNILVRAGQGKVMANTGSGNVRVELALERLQELQANSGSGNVTIEVSSVEGELDANSGSGDVTVRLVEASSPGATNLNTGSGDVRLVVPANIVGSFDLQTYGGEIQVPRSLGLEVRREVGGQHQARGTIGGGGGKYKLRSGSGEVAVEIGNALPVEK